MRKAAQKMLPPVFLLGIFICFSSLLWLAIYAGTNRADALAIGAIVLLCALAQVAAWLGGRVFKTSRLWPAACMLASAPTALWCAYIGPATLYGSAINLLDFTGLDSKPPFYYFALPVLVAGVLVCVGWTVVGLLSLAADITEMAAERRQAAVLARHKRLLAKPEDDAAAPQVAENAEGTGEAPDAPAAEDAGPAPDDEAGGTDEDGDTGEDGGADSAGDAAEAPLLPKLPTPETTVLTKFSPPKAAATGPEAAGPGEQAADDDDTKSDKNEGETANDPEEK